VLHILMKKFKKFLSLFVLPITILCTGCSFLFDYSPANPYIYEQQEEKSIVLPSSIRINLNNKTKKTITPTLKGFTDKSPVFTFKSNDETIVTVDANGVLTPVKVGKTNVVVTYTKDTKYSGTVEVEVLEETMQDYTIMFYMCASDLEYSKTTESDGHGHNSVKESKPALFTEDIKELLSVKNIPDSVKIIIQTGGTKKWLLPSSYLDGATEISAGSVQRWEISNGKLKHIATLNTNYMASKASFQDFLTWGLNDYPADQMGVVLSGHGGGIAGCAYDDNYTYAYGGYSYQHTLRTFEVAEAAKNALAKSDRNKFTWIGYDCCVMQCADIASINADYFEYMVASQESENGSGWNHDIYLPYLTANTKIAPEEFLPKICDAYLLDNHTATEKEKCLQTLSVLDLSKMDTLTTEFNTYCNKIGTTSTTYNKVKSAFKYSYNAFGEAVYGLCDFNSLMNKLSNSFTTYSVDSIKNAVNDLVIYNSYCSKYTTIPCGVNAFFPESLDKDYDLQVGKEDYSNVLSTKFTTWQTLCVNNGNFGWDSI